MAAGQLQTMDLRYARGDAVYSLSIHADYRCRHSGACCTADWDVPVELPLYKTLDDALAAGRVAATGAT
jgi:hypothetical protein